MNDVSTFWVWEVKNPVKNPFKNPVCIQLDSHDSHGDAVSIFCIRKVRLEHRAHNTTAWWMYLLIAERTCTPAEHLQQVSQSHQLADILLTVAQLHGRARWDFP